MAAQHSDPRQRRTWTALRLTILRLAANEPVQEIAMARLAREAGVHRSTVYQHVASPGELLAQVLQDELDLLRDQLQVQTSALDSAVRQVVLGVLEHLERHEAIYRRELAEPGSAVTAMLVAHFAGSVETVLAQHDLGAPVRGALPPDYFAASAAQWIAQGTVGAMRVWLERPSPRDPALYLDLHAALLPPWWPYRRSL